MSHALLVVDVQNYFVTGKAEGLPERIAWHIKESSYDHILFAKFRNDPASNFHQLLHFTEATTAPATDLHPAIAEFATPENTFEKTTYSALKAPGLLSYLETKDVTRVDLCGISFDACVLATAYELFDLGYQLTILDNLCSVSSVRDDLKEAAQTIVDRDLRRRELRTRRD